MPAPSSVALKMLATCVCRLRSIAFGVALILPLSKSLSAEFEYHPSSTAAIGFGIDPQNPETLFAVRALDSDGVENIDTTSGVVEGTIELTEVRTRQQLLKATGTSFSIEAHSAFASGSASMSEASEVSFDSSSLVWVAATRIHFGRFRLKNQRPSRDLLNTAFNRVTSVFGREIVTQETRGAVAAVVFEVNGLSIEQKQTLSSAIGASYSGGVFGGSAQTTYSAAVQEVQKQSTIRVRFFTRGGPGSTHLAAIAEGPSDLKTIRETLAKYIKATNQNNAKPLTYTTSPISQFKEVVITEPPNLPQDRLWEIYEEYANLTVIIRRIDELIRPTTEDNTYLASLVSQDTRKRLQKLREQYDEARAKYRNVGVQLIKGHIEPVPDVTTLDRIDWPVVPRAPYAVFPPHELPPREPEVPTGPPAAPSGLRIVSSPSVEYVAQLIFIIGDSKVFKAAYEIQGESRIPKPVVFRDGSSTGGPSNSKEFEQLRNTAARNTGEVRRLAELHGVNTADILGITYIPIEKVIGADSGTEKKQYGVEIVDKLGRKTQLRFAM